MMDSSEVNSNDSTKSEIRKDREKLVETVSEKLKRRKQKSVFVAYVCWLLGGLAGLHHFYLVRNNQGFIWWTTCGGFFLGYLRDLWRLPDYVRESNLDPSFVKSLIVQAKQWKQPEFRGIRFLGMLTVGMFYGYLVQFAIPENCFSLNRNEHKLIWIVAVPLAVAFGNYLVANIGYETVSFGWCAAGAFAPSLFLPFNPDMTSYCALFSTVVAYWKRSFRKSVIPKKQSVRKLVSIITGILFYSLLWYSLFYYNVSVVTKEGERVQFRDLVSDYFHDKDFKQDAWSLLTEMRSDLWAFWREMRSQVHSFRVMEDTQSYMILGLEWGASEDQVTERFRELARKFHPDKNTGADASTLADYNARMLDITRAYEALTKKRKRGRKGKKMFEEKEREKTSTGHDAKDEL